MQRKEAEIIYDVISPAKAQIIRVLPRVADPDGSVSTDAKEFKRTDWSKLNAEQRKKLRESGLKQDQLLTYQCTECIDEYLHAYDIKDTGDGETSLQWMFATLKRPPWGTGKMIDPEYDIKPPFMNYDIIFGHFEVPEFMTSYDIVLSRDKIKTIEGAVSAMEQLISAQHDGIKKCLIDLK